MRFMLSLLLIVMTVCACAPVQMDGWGFPVGQDTTAQAEPLQKPDNFDQKLMTIKKNLEVQKPLQMGEAPVAQDTKPQAKTIKIALVVPMSGASQPLGMSMLTAGQIAMKDYGAQNFELLPRDSGTSPESARTAVNQSIKDGAQLILGPVFADQVRATRALAANAGIPMIGFTTDSQVADRNTFIMGFLPAQQIARVVNFVQQRGTARLLVVTPATPFGTMAADTVLAMPNVTSTIIKVTDNETPEAIAIKLRTQLAPKTAILFAQDGPQTARLVGLLEAQGVTPENTMMLGTGLLDDPRLSDLQVLENVYFVSAPLDLRARFAQRYISIAKKPPERLASLAYDAVALALAVARDTRNPDMPFPLGAIHDKAGFSGVDGIFRFGEEGQVDRGLSVLTWRAGTLIEIDKAPRSF